MEKFAIAAPLCALTRCKICDSGALQWTGSPLSAESRGSCRGSAPFRSFLSTPGCNKNAMKTAPTILKFAIVGPSHSHYIEKVHGNLIFFFSPCLSGAGVPAGVPAGLLQLPARLQTHTPAPQCRTPKARWRFGPLALWINTMKFN